MYDLVIRNGDIVDGSGLPRFRADVAIQDDRIAAVGRIRSRGRREIDAEGHVVTPGFIDGHTHMDAQVFWDPLGTCSCWHGVTTVVMGNCGFTLAPARPDARALVVRNLERAEDISARALQEGIDWAWESFPEYLDAVDRQPKAINYAANIGHSALRTWVMGERAFESPADVDDLDRMAAQLRIALAAGAIGFTTSRTPAHQTSDGRPVASLLASWEEVTHLVGVLGEEGHGIFQLATERVVMHGDALERSEANTRLLDLAVATGVPVTFGVIATPIASADQLALLDRTAERGGRMFGQSHSRGILSVLSFGTRMPFDVLPEWRAVRDQPLEAQRRIFEDHDRRRELVAAARHGDYGAAIGVEARAPDYDRMRLLDRALPPNPTVAAVAAQRGVDPVDAIIDLALESDFGQMFTQPITSDDPDILLSVMKHPRTIMTFSDSGAHVSQIMDSSIQTHLLGYWVRERGDFSLEEAVRSITFAPATAWGFTDRGLVRQGFVADLNIIDPATVGPALPVVEHDLPGGGARLKQNAIGIRATIVAGEATIEHGHHTGSLPGQLLRSRAHA